MKISGSHGDTAFESHDHHGGETDRSRSIQLISSDDSRQCRPGGALPEGLASARGEHMRPVHGSDLHPNVNDLSSDFSIFLLWVTGGYAPVPIYFFGLRGCRPRKGQFKLAAGLCTASSSCFTTRVARMVQLITRSHLYCGVT